MHRGEKIPFAPTDPFSSPSFCFSPVVLVELHTYKLPGCAVVTPAWFGAGFIIRAGFRWAHQGSMERAQGSFLSDHSGKGQWHLFEVICALCVPAWISSLKLKLLKGQIKTALDTIKPKEKFYMYSTRIDRQSAVLCFAFLSYCCLL